MFGLPTLHRAARLIRAAAAHPATAGRPLDDAGTLARRRAILREKRFLRALYEDWYGMLAAALPAAAGPVVELGSGAGFMGARLPGVLTSDLLACPGLHAQLDGQRLPFCSASLRAIAMVNVLHHLPDVARFFAEAARCLRRGGAVVMLEPWLTPWSRLVYAQLQDEPCEPAAAGWRIGRGGPLSGANLALPWILFQRDRERFARRFPQLALDRVQPTMPLAYLLSGGIATRVGMPGWSYAPWRRLERRSAALERRLAMFALIRVRRVR